MLLTIPPPPHSSTVFLYCWTCYHPQYNWTTTHWMLSNNQSLNKYLDSNNLYFFSFIFSNSGHFGRSTVWKSIILKGTTHKKSFGRWCGWTFPMFHLYVQFLSTMVVWDLNNQFNIFVPILCQDQDFQHCHSTLFLCTVVWDERLLFVLLNTL